MLQVVPLKEVEKQMDSIVLHFISHFQFALFVQIYPTLLNVLFGSHILIQLEYY